MPLSLERSLRVCALSAAGLVLAMLAIFLFTGVGQDPLQYVHSTGDYTQILLRNPAVLRAAIGLDSAFIVLYSSTFVLLAILLLRSGSARSIVLVSTVFLLALALLDMAENFHFMVMISRAEQGISPSAFEIEAQVWESLLKFHVSYLGLFLLGFATPRQSAKGRWLARLSWYFQMPLGILIYVGPAALAVPLVFLRFGYFLTALLLVASLFPLPEQRLSST